MGYICHHTIVVTGMGESIDFLKDPFPLKTAHEKAKEIFPVVSEITPIKMNGYASFFVPPDGSKEGWADSDIGDRGRNAFVEYLLTTDLAWVEVQFGDEGGVIKVVRDSYNTEKSK